MTDPEQAEDRARTVSVQLFNLLLYLAAELQRMRNLVKWLRSSTGTDHHDSSVTQHSSESCFAHFDAFHFIQQHFNGFAAG